MKKVIFFAGVLIISAFFTVYGIAYVKITEISVEQANAAVQDKNVQFIDVRTPGEFSEGYAQNAVNFPLDSLEKDLTKLDKSKAVYVICRTGRRSQIASETLDKAGFTEVYNIAGGMIAWKTANLPMAK